MNKRLVVLILAVVFFGLGLVQIVRHEKAKSQDNYWTPANNMQSIAVGTQYEKIYVEGQELTHLIQGRQLVVKGKQGDADVYTPVKEDQVGVRVNHKFEVINRYLASAAGLFGAAIGLLLGSLICRIGQKSPAKK